MDHPLPARGDRTTRRRRGAALLVVVAALVAVLAACGTVQAFSDLDGALEDAGFSKVGVNVAAGDPVTLTVSADSPAGTSTEEAQDQAAEVVWTTFPRSFDDVRITIDGESRTLTSEELQERFGDRPAGLVEGDLSDDVSRLSIGLVVGVLLAGVVVVGTGGVVALLVVRHRRRTAPRAPRGPWAPHPGAVAHPGPLPGAVPPGPGAPVPPPGGWVPVAPPPGPPPPGAPHAPPSAPPVTPADADAAPGAPGGAPAEEGVAPEPPPWWTTPRPPTPGVVHPRSHREARADARRHGRPVRGPRPPESQIPPGWG